ncbi:thymidylate kinase [Duganella sp. Leaf126]|uniref:dTMP kinase n=1 Tax=Duganella sp. Leaf126 TaxID=1736266 RepID=UPI0006F265CF|nr:dTMP kinase [Duganella sp. Leaf126]KQQ44710.1 thymidylate kinase [Duganella sp. Leaf126]
MPFISIEGIDGSGKTNQVRMLVERLKSLGEDVLQTKEPDGGHLGAEVRAILTCPDRQLAPAEQLLLVSAARFDHVRSVIRPALTNGKWVISDRFIDSTYAFQVAVSDDDLYQLFRSTREIVVGTTLPDLTIILDLPLDVAFGRRELRRDGVLDPAEAMRDFAAIREGLLTVAREDTKRCHVINANQTLNAVAQDIWCIVQRLL